ncbi:hypothetical protein G9A89_011551 [Geosiphon pyriformis]|nr:hypothetical protein G9A89_011551 [Geosiphon pyriformis]
MIRLWPLPAFFILFNLIGAILGVIGGKFLGLSGSHTKFVANGIMFNNVSSLPISLIQGLTTTEAMKVLLMNEMDTPVKAASRGMSYTLLNILFSSIIRFSLGTYMTKKESNVVTAQPSDQGSLNENSLLLPHPQHKDKKNRSVFSISICVINKIRNFMNPPLYAAILAIVVGIITPFKKIFFGTSAPLYPSITHAIEYIGEITIPVTLLCLGAQMKNFSPLKNRSMLPAISYILLCRFIIMPAIAIVLVILTRNWYFQDPMLWFVLMLSASGPSAINIINIAQITGTFQEETTALLLYSYLVTTPILVAYLVIMLSIIGEILY